MATTQQTSSEKRSADLTPAQKEVNAPLTKPTSKLIIHNINNPIHRAKYIALYLVPTKAPTYVAGKVRQPRESPADPLPTERWTADPLRLGLLGVGSGPSSLGLDARVDIL